VVRYHWLVVLPISKLSKIQNACLVACSIINFLNVRSQMLFLNTS